MTSTNTNENAGLGLVCTLALYMAAALRRKIAVIESLGDKLQSQLEQELGPISGTEIAYQLGQLRRGVGQLTIGIDVDLDLVAQIMIRFAQCLPQTIESTKLLSLLSKMLAASFAKDGDIWEKHMPDLLRQLAAQDQDSGRGVSFAPELLQIVSWRLIDRNFGMAAAALEGFVSALTEPACDAAIPSTTDVTASPPGIRLSDDDPTVEIEVLDDFRLSPGNPEDENGSKEAIPVIYVGDLTLDEAGRDPVRETLEALFAEEDEPPSDFATGGEEIDSPFFEIGDDKDDKDDKDRTPFAVDPAIEPPMPESQVDYSAREKYAQYLREGGVFLDMPIDPLPSDTRRDPKLVHPADYPLTDSSEGKGDNPVPAADSPISEQGGKPHADSADEGEADKDSS